MFCKYCGKQLPDGDICPECAAKLEEKASASVASAAPVPQKNRAAYNGAEITKRFGIGKAITAIVTGIACDISSVLGFVFALLALFGKHPDTVYEGMTPEQIEAFRSMTPGFSVAADVLLCISVVLAAVALVFGIKSIKNFTTAKAQGVKPVVTLVFGITGVVCGAISLFMTLMGFFWVLAGNVVAA